MKHIFMHENTENTGLLALKYIVSAIFFICVFMNLENGTSGHKNLQLYKIESSSG